MFCLLGCVKWTRNHSSVPAVPVPLLLSGCATFLFGIFSASDYFYSDRFRTKRNNLQKFLFCSRGKKLWVFFRFPLNRCMHLLLLTPLPFDSFAESEESDNSDPPFVQQQYTVEDAVEHMGFGWFQLKIFVICGLFSVSDAYIPPN